MRTCSHCGSPYQPKVHNQRFCSDRCRDARLGRRRREVRGTTTERGLGGEYRRNRLLALERDGWICMVPRCTQLTRTIWREAPQHHPMYPSADHIIPRWQGGTSELSNLRASHLGCNRTLGASQGGQIMAARKRGQWVSSAPRITPASSASPKKQAAPRPDPQPRQCSECATTFTPKRQGHTTCSRTCSHKRNNRVTGQRIKERYHADPAFRARVITAAKESYGRRRSA